MTISPLVLMLIASDLAFTHPVLADRLVAVAAATRAGEVTLILSDEDAATVEAARERFHARMRRLARRAA